MILLTLAVGSLGTLAACSQGAVQTAPAGAAARRGWMAPAAKRQGLVYVSDYDGNAIEIYPQGVDDPAPIGEITDGIAAPLGNFVGADGTLYVANSSSNTITEYPKGSTSPSVTLSDGINGPISVAADRKGNVAVGEFAQGEIVEFAAGSSSPSLTISLLTYPEGLAFDRAGHLYAAWNAGSRSSLTGDVSRCKKFEAICNDWGIAQGQSGGLALDKAGNVVLGDQANQVVNVYAPHATVPLRTIAMAGHDPYKFELDKAQKRLYVADIATGTVAIYDYVKGTLLGSISKGLQSAWGVSLSPPAKDGRS